MSSKFNSRDGVSVKAYQGDAMTLLAFDLQDDLIADCAGFTIRFTTPAGKSFYLLNRLNFDQPTQTDSNKGIIYSTLDCPIQKFRCLHILSSGPEGDAEFGLYTYHVTPRYWKNNALADLDPALTVDIALQLKPFQKNNFSVSLTRSFMSSQAYTRRFGNDTKLTPDDEHILFDSSKVSGSFPADAEMKGDYTYEDQFAWLGWLARRKILDFIRQVTEDTTGTLSLDVLAYDFTEPDIAAAFLELAKKGKIRMILDNSEMRPKDYRNDKNYKTKLDFETRFRSIASNAVLVRGSYEWQAHSKILILKDGTNAIKVLTGSTDFSIDGLCVNANHVIVLEDKTIAGKYLEVFEASLSVFSKEQGWTTRRLKELELFSRSFEFNQTGLPRMKISFAPHKEDNAAKVLGELTTAINDAEKSVLFAVIRLTQNAKGSTAALLRDMNAAKELFTFGITDESNGVKVYNPGTTGARLVSSEALTKSLPEPFKTVVSAKQGNRLHHKIVVLDFKDANPVVYCGSSNFGLGLEEMNGDNILAIYDEDVATVFAIETLRLTDHFQYLAALAVATKQKPLLLAKGDTWLKNYYIDGEMDFIDRNYFIK
ncbi:MAG: PLD-like domain protein [Mucilaginibacter sp.]|nr:PLD-like domain protein [Mucilaginibacter sp.]